LSSERDRAYASGFRRREATVDDGRLQLTLLSAESEHEQITFTEGKIVKTENLVVDVGECAPGEGKGDVTFEESDQPKASKVGVLGTIDLGNGTLTIAGTADRETYKGKKSFKGKLAITGGTGDYDGWTGEVDVDNCNPKRWRIDAGP
jgi:restriction endonuclease S subunit